MDTKGAPASRLVFAPAAELERWQCRPLGTIEMLDLKDRHVGHLDGLLIDRHEDRPTFLVIARDGAKRGEHKRFLVPVGDAWFDETERAVRIDVSPRERVAF